MFNWFRRKREDAELKSLVAVSEGRAIADRKLMDMYEKAGVLCLPVIGGGLLVVDLKVAGQIKTP